MTGNAAFQAAVILLCAVHVKDEALHTACGCRPLYRQARKATAGHGRIDRSSCSDMRRRRQLPAGGAKSASLSPAARACRQQRLPRSRTPSPVRTASSEAHRIPPMTLGNASMPGSSRSPATLLRELRHLPCRLMRCKHSSTADCRAALPSRQPLHKTSAPFLVLDGDFPPLHGEVLWDELSPAPTGLDDHQQARPDGRRESSVFPMIHRERKVETRPAHAPESSSEQTFDRMKASR